jgi:hypothetical protein
VALSASQSLSHQIWLLFCIWATDYWRLATYILVV